MIYMHLYIKIKTMRQVFSMISNLQNQLSFKTNSENVQKTYKREVVNPRQRTPQGQSVANTLYEQLNIAS